MIDNQISSFINSISDTFGSGDFDTAIRNIMLIALVFFNIPTFISIVRREGAIEITGLFGLSLVNMLAAMTPFTFPAGYIGWWHSLKRSIS